MMRNQFAPFFGGRACIGPVSTCTGMFVPPAPWNPAPDGETTGGVYRAGSPPSGFDPKVKEELARRGQPSSVIEKVLGANFQRIIGEIWATWE